MARSCEQKAIPDRSVPERVSEYLQVSDVWLISIDGQLVCGRLILRDEDVGRVRNLYEANSRFGDGPIARLSSSLNRYLDWQAMRYYRDRGFVTWDWGGDRCPPKGRRQVLQAFHGRRRYARIGRTLSPAAWGARHTASSPVCAEPVARPGGHDQGGGPCGGWGVDGRHSAPVGGSPTGESYSSRKPAFQGPFSMGGVRFSVDSLDGWLGRRGGLPVAVVLGGGANGLSSAEPGAPRGSGVVGRKPRGFRRPHSLHRGR